MSSDPSTFREFPKRRNDLLVQFARSVDYFPERFQKLSGLSLVLKPIATDKDE